MATSKEEILTLLADLVAFKSLTPAEGGSFKYIEDYLRRCGASLQRIDRNATSNLIARLGSGKTIFAFAGHVDVVPSGETSLWKNGDPFSLYQDQQQLIGRGVADMKGAIAAFLVAVREFVARNALNDFQIMLLLTSDEEGSAIDGTPLIVEYLQQQQIRLNYCLIGEPSSVKRLGDTVKVGRRGSLTGSLSILGKQGHIAYPELASNPIQRALPALSELSQIVWDEGNEYFPPTSLQFANINAGLGVTNVIPGQLSCDFNFRYNNLHSHHQLQMQVAAVLTKHNLNYQLEWNHSAAPFLTEVADLLRITNQAIEQVCGYSCQAKTDGGTSDGRFLCAVSDELIELGLSNASIHQINEATTLNDLLQLTEVYQIILAKIFKQ